MPAQITLPVGAAVKVVSFSLTTTGAAIKTWLAGGTDTNTGVTVAFSLDNIAQVYLVGYTGTILFGGSNSQPATWPANSDFTIPSMSAHNDVYIKSSSGTFTVYAIVVFAG